MPVRRSGVWDRKTGQHVFKNSAEAAKYFFEELRKLLGISKEKYAKQGLSFDGRLLDLEVSIGFRPENYKEALVFAEGGRHLADILSSERVMNVIIKKAFLYGVVHTNEGQGLKDLWFGGGYGSTVEGERATPFHSVEEYLPSFEDPRVRPWVPKKGGFKGERRSITR